MNSSFIKSEPNTDGITSALKKSVRKLTIKQLHTIESHIIDNTEVTTIKLVGYVTELKSSKTGVSFKLFDTTGEIDCNFWPNGLFDEGLLDYVKDNSLIRILGTNRTFNDKLNIVVSTLSPVDANDLIYHLTESLYERQINLNKIVVNKNKTGGEEKSATEIESEILKLIRGNQSQTGIHLNTIIAMLNGVFSSTQIKEALDNLSHNCHVYQIDGENYKSTTNE